MGEAAEEAYKADGGQGDLYPKPRKHHTCPTCGRKFKKHIGLVDHVRDVHGGRTD